MRCAIFCICAVFYFLIAHMLPSNQSLSRIPLKRSSSDSNVPSPPKQAFLNETSCEDKAVNPRGNDANEESRDSVYRLSKRVSSM